MKNFLKIILILIIIFLVVWLCSLAKCEISSLLHSDEFYGLDESSTNMVEKVENIKVLKYTSKHAKVYYYDKSGACVFEFEKLNNKWQMISWDSVWSATGSASETIWPYWWHFIYGGF